jgi:hypothetical protein
MTLRLDTTTDDLIIEAAYDRRMSKATYIRAAIHRCLGMAEHTPHRVRTNHEAVER